MARTRWLATAAAWSCVAILVSPPGRAADDSGSPAPDAAGDRDGRIIQVLLSGSAEERLETAAHLPLDLRFEIGRHDDPAPATEALVGDLVLVLRQEPDEWIARTLLESLSWRTQPAFDPLFLEGLRSVSVNLQATAIGRYRFREDAEAAATLETLWERDLPGWIRPRLLAALATQGSISHLDEFVHLTRDADAELRRAAIEALGRLGRDETVPVLARVLRDEPRSDVVVSAIRALGSFPDSGEALEEVLRASRSTDPSILGAAVVSLGRFPQWEAGARLIALLDAPPDQDLRAAIPRALEATTHPDATAALVRLLQEPDVTPNSWIASRAIMALWNRDDPGALPGLVDLREASGEGARDDLDRLIEYLSRDRSEQNRTFMLSTDCPTGVVSSGDPDSYRVAPSQPFLSVRCWGAPDRPGNPATHPRIPAGTPVRIVDHFERPHVSWVEIDGRGVNSCWVPRDALHEGGVDREPASWPRIHLRVEVDLGAEDLASPLATRLRAAGILSVFEPGDTIEGAALELDAADRDQAATAAALVPRDATPLAGALRTLLSQGLEDADGPADPDPGSGPDEDAADPDAGGDAKVDGTVDDSR